MATLSDIKRTMKCVNGIPQIVSRPKDSIAYEWAQMANVHAFLYMSLNVNDFGKAVDALDGSWDSKTLRSVIVNQFLRPMSLNRIIKSFTPEEIEGLMPYIAESIEDNIIIDSTSVSIDEDGAMCYDAMYNNRTFKCKKTAAGSSLENNAAVNIIRTLVDEEKPKKQLEAGDTVLISDTYKRVTLLKSIDTLKGRIWIVDDKGTPMLQYENNLRRY